MERHEDSRGTIPADWQFERARALGPARGGATGERNRHGADRKKAPSDGGLHFEGDGEARRGIVDVARSGVAVRDCRGERAADSDWRDRKLDVEEQEDPHPRRSALEDPAFDALLFVAQGCEPVPGGVRRVSDRKE